jgi:hypothetical protein
LARTVLLIAMVRTPVVSAARRAITGVTLVAAAAAVRESHLVTAAILTKNW